MAVGQLIKEYQRYINDTLEENVEKVRDNNKVRNSCFKSPRSTIHKKLAQLSDINTQKIEEIRRTQKEELEVIRASNGEITRKLDSLFNMITKPRDNRENCTERNKCPLAPPHQEKAVVENQLRLRQHPNYSYYPNNPLAPGPHRSAEDQRGSAIVQDIGQARAYVRQDLGEHMSSGTPPAPALRDKDVVETQLRQEHHRSYPSEHPQAPVPWDRAAEDAQLRKSQEQKFMMKKASLPLCDGTHSFKGYRTILERYFHDIDCSKNAQSSLFLTSLAKGNKKAKKFYSEIIENGKVDASYFELITKAESFFRNQTTVDEYLLNLNNMKQFASESLDDWYTRLFTFQQEALNSSGIDSISIIKACVNKRFIFGIQDEQVSHDLRIHTLDKLNLSLRELLNLAEKIEKGQELEKIERRHKIKRANDKNRSARTHQNHDHQYNINRQYLPPMRPTYQPYRNQEAGYYPYAAPFDPSVPPPSAPMYALARPMCAASQPTTATQPMCAASQPTTATHMTSAHPPVFSPPLPATPANHPLQVTQSIQEELTSVAPQASLPHEEWADQPKNTSSCRTATSISNHRNHRMRSDGEEALPKAVAPPDPSPHKTLHEAPKQYPQFRDPNNWRKPAFPHEPYQSSIPIRRVASVIEENSISCSKMKSPITVQNNVENVLPAPTASSNNSFDIDVNHEVEFENLKTLLDDINEIIGSYDKFNFNTCETSQTDSYTNLNDQLPIHGEPDARPCNMEISPENVRFATSPQEQIKATQEESISEYQPTAPMVQGHLHISLNIPRENNPTSYSNQNVSETTSENFSITGHTTEQESRDALTSSEDGQHTVSSSEEPPTAEPEPCDAVTSLEDDRDAQCSKEQSAGAQEKEHLRSDVTIQTIEYDGRELSDGYRNYESKSKQEKCNTMETGLGVSDTPEPLIPVMGLMNNYSTIDYSEEKCVNAIGINQEVNTVENPKVKDISQLKALCPRTAVTSQEDDRSTMSCAGENQSYSKPEEAKTIASEIEHQHTNKNVNLKIIENKQNSFIPCEKRAIANPKIPKTKEKYEDNLKPMDTISTHRFVKKCWPSNTVISYENNRATMCQRMLSGYCLLGPSLPSHSTVQSNLKVLVCMMKSVRLLWDPGILDINSSLTVTRLKKRSH